MNWIKRKIINCANAIKEKEEKYRAEQNQEYSKKRLEHEALRAAATEEIMRNLDAYAARALKTPPELEAGDEAVFNAFNLVGYRNSDHYWDGGANAFLSNLFDDELVNGLKVTIKSVKLNDTQVQARIENFFDRVTDDQLEVKSLIWPTFVNMMCPRLSVENYQYFDRFGFYWSATFETSTRFKPKWELHVSAFIKKGTPGYEETLEIAQSKADLKKLTAAHLELVSSIEQRIGNIKRSVK